MQQAVGIEHEPADVGLLQELFDALGIGAFGQPNTLGFATETGGIMIARRQDLRADRRWRNDRTSTAGKSHVVAAAVVMISRRPSS